MTPTSLFRSWFAWLGRWLRRLDGRALLLMLGAVTAVHLGSIAIHHDEAAVAAEALMASQLAARLAVAIRAVEAAPAAERQAAARSLSSASLSMRFEPSAALPANAPGVLPLLERLRSMAPSLAPVDLRLAVTMPGPGAYDLPGTAALPGGGFINFSAHQAAPAPERHTALVSTTLMTAAVAVLAIIVMRRVTSPLRRLVTAADAIGRGPPVTVAEDGPDEVRHVAVAFNGMQARIERLIADRIQALAAVSHDLRTPLTRMRLRTGFLGDPEAQRAMDADLDEMEAMIEATLHFLRAGTEAENPKRTDLAILLQTVVDDMVDAGHDATYEGPRHLPVTLRALSLKRALANVVGNAVVYGTRARVTLRADPGAATILIDDDGPGIPDSDRQRAFEPFDRLDASRGSQKGGVGLGLAIARQSIEQEGSIRLLDAPSGGLRVEIILPAG